MLLLNTNKARSVALGLALTAVPSAAAVAASAPSLRGTRALYTGASGDFDEDASSASDWVARLGESGCAIHERYVAPACDDPDDCEPGRSYACVDLGSGEEYVVDNDLEGIFTGDGTFAFEDDAGAHLHGSYGELVFVGEASVNLRAMRVSFVSGTFTMAERHVPDLEIVPDAASYADVGGGGYGPSGDYEEDEDVMSRDQYVPSDKDVAVAGTAAVAQTGHGGTLGSVKGEYDHEEAVTLTFDLASAAPGNYRVGLFMRMANPQEGALPPLASLPLPSGATSGSVTFSQETMGMMGWPLNLYEYGTGYDAYVLDGNGADVVGPAQFNVIMED